jgi:hypothetical protein
MSVMVGQVTAERYRELVAEGRQAVEAMGAFQWRLGDIAVEICPMQPHGGQQRSASGEEGLLISSVLAEYAEDVGLSAHSVENFRWTSSRWPRERRVAGISYTVHRILGSEGDEHKRFSLLAGPPKDGARWTPDEANRHMGRAVHTPRSAEEKVRKVADLVRDEEVAAAALTGLLERPEVTDLVSAETRASVIDELTRDERVAAVAATRMLGRPGVSASVTREAKARVALELVRDEEVAAEVATGLLGRPRVAARVVEDTVTRDRINRAQVDRVAALAEQAEKQAPRAAEARRAVAHTMGFMELVGMCAAFTAAAGRVVPSLGGVEFTGDERETLERNLLKVKGALEWIETALVTGNTGLDAGLAQLLSGS